MSYNHHFGYKYARFGEDTKGMDLKAFGDTTGKYVFWDASADTFYVVGVLDLTGNVQLDGTFTVGVDDTGYDVTFFGATSGKKFFWDESADTAFLTCTVDIDGTVTVGTDATGYDVKFFGDTTGKYFLWDESGDEVILTDGVSLNFGTGLDVDIAWDGTNLNILPVTDDTGVINFGNGTKDMDVKMFLNATTKYVLFDVGNSLLTLEDVDLHLGDGDRLEFGDAATGDVGIVWNGTNLTIMPAVDDTGAIYFGDGTTDMDVRMTLGAAGDYAQFDVGAKSLLVAGEARIDLSSATIAAANTDGGLIKGGTSGARIVEDTANMKFMSFYFDDGATSGTAVGIYDRLYVTGEGGSGQALRAFATVEDVAAVNVYGAHISTSFGTAGSITGLGNALATTLHVPGAMTGGTYASQTVEVWADGAASSFAAVTDQGFFRVGLGGDGTGVAAMDEEMNLFNFYGVTAGSGKFIDTAITTHTAYGGIPVAIPGVGVRYLALVSN